MAENCFHSSIEGAQHGAKSLTAFLDYAKTSGAFSAQPSNYMLQDGAKFKKPAEIKEAFASRGMTFDGISAHCPFWVHTSAWTGSPTGRPFLPAEVAGKSAAEIEKWSESYLMRFLDLAAALEGKMILTFLWVPLRRQSRVSKDLQAIQKLRAEEQLRQEREVFEQRKLQEARWFCLRLFIGYFSTSLLAAVLVIAYFILRNHVDYSASVVGLAGAMVFTDVIALVLVVWKFAMNPKSIRDLSPVTNGSFSSEPVSTKR